MSSPLSNHQTWGYRDYGVLGQWLNLTSILNLHLVIKVFENNGKTSSNEV